MARVTVLESVSPLTAKSSLIDIAQKQLIGISENEIRLVHKELTELWDSQELFHGTINILSPIILRNLERIAKEPGFHTFRVIMNPDENCVEIMAIFSKTFVPVRMWRSGETFFVCGNRLFASQTLKKWWQFWVK